ncbi:MAG: PD-(D/E)XK nuclease family protein [Bacteroidales bacterium]|nr:PD-(D/E)XK nuclease family protein [Bacteroidales bacterium]
MVFLEEVAKDIASRSSELDNYCIVCPNIRTIDYLKHYLSKILRKTVWSPKFMNLSELSHSFTDFSKTDELVMMIELYKSFKHIFKESKYFSEYNFDRFYGIGEIILKDFNEIDNYLINIKKIFINISDYESINYIEDYLSEEQIETIKQFFKHFSTDSISEEKEYFKELWSSIPKLYEDFKANLISKKIGYNGLINKDLCKKIDNNELNFDKYEKYMFVGFNALTKSQKYLLEAFHKAGKALFYWDYDNFYVKDLENEAGLFVRENLAQFPDDLKIDRDCLLKDKKIKLIGFPLEIAQTKAIPTILEQMNIDLKDKSQLAQTAIVMPDDNLLFPVLHSLPTEIEQVNVTLGFPFKNTSIYNFINQWLNTLQIIIKKSNIYYDDLINFLDNQILKEIFEGKHDYVIEEIKNSKKIYFNINDLESQKNYLFRLLFNEKNITDVEILLENILKILEIIFFVISKTERKVEAEAIYQFYKQMLNIQTLFTKELVKDKEIISVRIMLRFLKNQLSGVHIPFQGKSLDGLQLMTIMETRNLDFDNLIILNVNEQILPKKATNSSLISEFMRKSFGLPVLMYQDSIFAFLFYSLIQNSKNIVLTYSNLISDKSGEISRFVQQLQHETNLISEHLQYAEQIRPKRPAFFEIEKNAEVYAKLTEYLSPDKLLSASALNTYITCPLKFYFQRIAKIDPPEIEQNEFEIDALKFGNIFHNTMEELYKPYVGKIIEKSDFEEIKKRIVPTIEKTIFEILENVEQATEEGINTIISNVIKKHIEDFIKIDIDYAPFKIVSLEDSTKYNGIFKINIKDKEYNIKLLSIFDRVDQKNNLTRIIDYKTGSDDLSVSNLTSLFDIEKAKNSKKAIFQMLLYSIIYKQNNPNLYFEPLLLKTRDVNQTSDGKLTVNKQQIDSNSVDIFADFEGNLIALLEEIFEEEINFEQTENLEACMYCDYSGICGR